MKKIKLTEADLTKIINKVINERKKRKPKVEDTKYTKWCKEHGWEHGVGEGCADDALDSEDTHMRSWAIGFILGKKESSLNEGKRSLKIIKEQEETITHEELMDGIDKYCPEVLEKEKMVGNRSCSRCHTPLMGIIKRWCESNKN